MLPYVLLVCNGIPDAEKGEASAPTFFPPPTTVIGSLSVEIATASPKVTIRYTTDGSDPGESSTLYEHPVEITESATLKAIAYGEGLKPSEITSGTYTIEAAQHAQIFHINPTKYNPSLDGINLPSGLTDFTGCQARAARDEYSSCSMLIDPEDELQNVSLSWTPFEGSSGSLPADVLDPYVVKVWWQAGLSEMFCPTAVHEPGRPRLVSELLLKDDDLVRVDTTETGSNALRVTQNGTSSYINIGESLSERTRLPAGAEVSDATELQPFSIDADHYKQLWFTIHVPSDASAGTYTSLVTLSSDEGTIGTFPVTIEVLPFDLGSAPIASATYYPGIIYDGTPIYSSVHRTPAQYRAELLDMREHGLLYPTSYMTIRASESHWDTAMQIRDDLGLPKDRFFYLDFPLVSYSLEDYEESILQLKQMVEDQYGYERVFVYGIDEAGCSTVQTEYPYWETLQENNMYSFVAISPMSSCSPHPSLHLYAPIIYARVPASSEPEASTYREKGGEPFTYANPQSGWENPEVFRVNYGLYAWNAGFSGTMLFAYHWAYGSPWYDFDDYGDCSSAYWTYRDHMMVYPTIETPISTIQWEGYREGQNDLRYIGTLLERIEALGDDPRASELEKFVNSLEIPMVPVPVDPARPPEGVGTISLDMDEVRGQIIDMILSSYAD
jgi:hypothetical protein